MLQVWLGTLVAFLPVPTVFTVVSQAPHPWVAMVMVGFTAPRTVLSVRVTYSVVHFGQDMDGVETGAAGAAGAGVRRRVAPLSCAEVLDGVQRATATATAKLVPTIEVSIVFFITFRFVLANSLLAVLKGLRTRPSKSFKLLLPEVLHFLASLYEKYLQGFRRSRVLSMEWPGCLGLFRGRDEAMLLLNP
jgi:hypothetical protein